MAMLVKAIPTFLMHVFAPVLGVCLAAWFVVWLVSAARGAPQTFGARPRAPGRFAWAGLIALAVACTLYSGKSPNGTNGVQNLPPQPMLQLPLRRWRIRHSARVLSVRTLAFLMARRSHTTRPLLRQHTSSSSMAIRCTSQ